MSKNNNRSLIDQVLDIINTLIEAAGYMYECALVRKSSQIEATASDMVNMLQILYPVACQIKGQIPYISAPNSCENLLYCVNTILRYVRTRSERINSKIEFELIPILQDFYYDFYFFTCVFGSKRMEKKHYEEEFNRMIGNHYIDQSMKTGEYKYDVSISVLAYNKIEYTKQCVESIIKFTPSYVNYELILINNGSEDGTAEYFESLSPTKIFSLRKNSLNIMTGAISRIYEGRYLLAISNDVIVTENYLENLMECIDSDPQIAMVVPTTPNISNLQAIPAQYSNLEEMHAFAKANNVSNPMKWEERTRLCNPLTFCRSDVFFSSTGVGAIDKYFVYGEFGDDALALRLRRAGCKMILAKDCYCYHFGSVTLGEAQVKESTLEKSRQLFLDRYGVDAWGTGFCFDMSLIEALNIKSKGLVNVLGINSGFGSNPLKIKTMHKEAGNQEVILYYLTDDERYVPDMKVYGDYVECVDDVIADVFGHTSFDYILLEENAESTLEMPDSLGKLKRKLNSGGTLAICVKSDNEIKMLNNSSADRIVQGYNCHWYLWMIK
ncbi:glycosyltransferase [Desulfitobacterium sp. THU1]|uniref:glycosyltransferase family 2 protein n=1 Tax=Desulfitobacterium sp. THU1 TaxID=3138072 RepID=UPI00311EE532